MGVRDSSKEAQHISVDANVGAGYPSPLMPLGDASMSTPMRSVPVGNPVLGQQGYADHEPPPIKIIYSTPVGRKTVEVPWRNGLRIRHYLRERRLIALWLRSRTTSQKTKRPIHLSYVPTPGEVIVMTPTSR